MSPLRALVFATALVPALALANKPARPPSTSAPATASRPDVPTAAPAPAAPDLGFDLLGEPQATTPRTAEDSHLARQVELRRTMLTTHQVAGLSTLTLLAATSVIGQLSYMDRFSSSAPGTGKFERPHTLLAGATVAGFAATGVLALLAPVPYDKPVKVDTTLAHKLFMAGATLGMLAEAGLGLYTEKREGYGNQRQLAQIHQAIGFTTLGCMGAGAGAFVY